MRHKSFRIKEAINWREICREMCRNGDLPCRVFPSTENAFRDQKTKSRPPMKFPKSVFSLFATAGVLAGFNAQAAPPAGAAHPQTGRTATTTVHARELSPSARISQGVRSGELTSTEIVRLRGESAELTSSEVVRLRDASAELTSTEVVRLRDEERNDLQQAAKDIHQQKHEGQFRNPSPPAIPSPDDITKARRARRSNTAAGARAGGEAASPVTAATQTEAQQLRSEVVEFRVDGQASQEGRLKIREDLRALRQR